MTLAQFEDYLKRRHNAESDDYWSSEELWQMITGRSNEALTIIGGIEATDTSTSTVASTQAYDIPDGFITVKALLWQGRLLQQIGFRDWERLKADTTTPEGDPEKYVIWNEQVLLIPVPDEAQTLTFYGEKRQTYIDDASDTIELPDELHFRLADGVLADMYAKDLNHQMARYYEEKWLSNHIPAFYRWKARKRRRARFQVVTDSDVAAQNEIGVV